jgi:hypothetical protein
VTARRRPALPTWVRVGAKRMQVIRSDELIEQHQEDTDTFVAGSSNYQHAVIVLPETVDPHDTEADTLLHEIIHMCLRASGCWPDDIKAGRHGLTVEEQIVAALTGPLLGVLRDHPDVVKYLTYDEPRPDPPTG